jgi:recombinational DNA repair protein RecT
MQDIASKEKMSKGSLLKGPWRTEMMRKSAIRRLLKYRVPSSTDIDEVIRENDDPLDPPPPAKTAETTSSRLRDAVQTTVEVPDNSDDVAAREDNLPL